MVTIAAIDAKGTAILKDANGNETTVELTGQQYLDYALVSTTYSSQGKTADQVLVTVDSTISKEGLYVAVSRAKQKLSLYTASKEKLLKQAERSTAKENPSDYLTLFQLVNPDAQNQKAADSARDVRGADQSEYLGDRAGERLEVSYRAAVRRDRAVAAGGEPAKSRASSLPSEYVADVRGVVAGIAERRRTEALERQAERIGEAAQGLIDGARQLELTAKAVARLDGALEQKAKGLSASRLEPNRDLASLREAARPSSAPESTAGQGRSRQVGGVAEVILKTIDPDVLARYEAQIAKAKAAEQPVEKKQEQAKYQEPSKQSQKRQVKKRDQGMEL